MVGKTNHVCMSINSKEGVPKRLSVLTHPLFIKVSCIDF